LNFEKDPENLEKSRKEQGASDIDPEKDILRASEPSVH